jgi:hypothetical protein
VEGRHYGREKVRVVKNLECHYMQTCAYNMEGTAHGLSTLISRTAWFIAQSSKQVVVTTSTS